MPRQGILKMKTRQDLDQNWKSWIRTGKAESEPEKLDQNRKSWIRTGKAESDLEKLDQNRKS